MIIKFKVIELPMYQEKVVHMNPKYANFATLKIRLFKT